MRDYPVHMWAQRLLTPETQEEDRLEIGSLVGGTGRAELCSALAEIAFGDSASIYA
jgi:hypothetical protein